VLASLSRHHLIRRVLDLGMPIGDFALAGSAPLLAHGLRSELGDVDVVARGEAWKVAQTFGIVEPAPSGNGSVVRIGGGEIEIFDRWISPDWPVDSLIRHADVIDGIRFVSLRDSLAWKRYLSRDKDRADIRLLEAYFHERFAGFPANQGPVGAGSKF
jgi:hypothetical protein